MAVQQVPASDQNTSPKRTTYPNVGAFNPSGEKKTSYNSQYIPSRQGKADSYTPSGMQNYYADPAALSMAAQQISQIQKERKKAFTRMIVIGASAILVAVGAIKYKLFSRLLGPVADFLEPKTLVTSPRRLEKQVKKVDKIFRKKGTIDNKRIPDIKILTEDLQSDEIVRCLENVRTISEKLFYSQKVPDIRVFINEPDGAVSREIRQFLAGKTETIENAEKIKFIEVSLKGTGKRPAEIKVIPNGSYYKNLKGYVEDGWGKFKGFFSGVIDFFHEDVVPPRYRQR